LNRVALT